MPTHMHSPFSRIPTHKTFAPSAVQRLFSFIPRSSDILSHGILFSFFFVSCVVPAQFSRPLGNPKRRRTRYVCITSHVHLSIPHSQIHPSVCPTPPLTIHTQKQKLP